jgi:hypothetical protein
VKIVESDEDVRGALKPGNLDWLIFGASLSVRLDVEVAERGDFMLEASFDFP